MPDRMCNGKVRVPASRMKKTKPKDTGTPTCARAQLSGMTGEEEDDLDFLLNQPLMAKRISDYSLSITIIIVLHLA
jgi:hypothetical protein